jgi:hypothetical protein
LCRENASSAGGKAQDAVGRAVGAAAAVAESAEAVGEKFWEDVTEHLKKTKTETDPDEEPEPRPPPPPPPTDRPKDDDCQIRYPYSASNFRENLACLTHNNYPDGPPTDEAHHVFPQKFQRQFDAILGPDEIHNPIYGTWWETSSHRQYSRAYQDGWELYLSRFNPGNPTMVQTLSFGRLLATRYGLRVYF